MVSSAGYHPTRKRTGLLGTGHGLEEVVDEEGTWASECVEWGVSGNTGCFNCLGGTRGPGPFSVKVRAKRGWGGKRRERPRSVVVVGNADESVQEGEGTGTGRFRKCARGYKERRLAVQRPCDVLSADGKCDLAKPESGLGVGGSISPPRSLFTPLAPALRPSPTPSLPGVVLAPGLRLGSPPLGVWPPLSAHTSLLPNTGGLNISAKRRHLPDTIGVVPPPPPHPQRP